MSVQDLNHLSTTSPSGLEISGLSVQKGSTTILKELNAHFLPGKTHIIMGPNGSGKSTFLSTIAGHPDCSVVSGNITYKNKELLSMNIHTRALEGVYLCPQYPPSIEGLSHAALLKESINARLAYRGHDPLDEFDFLKVIQKMYKKYHFAQGYTRQSFNSGFSGGERKRNELLQMELLEPTLILLDELDSGLDIEKMKEAAQHLLSWKNKDLTIVAVTHYPQFATLLEPDYLHILKNGTLTTLQGTAALSQIEKNGFEEIDL